jgi:hypothetical protein
MRAAATISEEVDIEGMGAEGRGTIMSMKMWKRRRRRRRRRKGRRRLRTDKVRESHTSQYEGAIIYHCSHCGGGGGDFLIRSVSTTTIIILPMAARWPPSPHHPWTNNKLNYTLIFATLLKAF